MAVGPGDSVVIPTPTFAMFSVEARLAGAGVVEVVRDDPGERQPVDVSGEAAERPAPGWCGCARRTTPPAMGTPPTRSPPWPMGCPPWWWSTPSTRRWRRSRWACHRRAPACCPCRTEFPNLLILRSLAKAYGLAGARVGYLVVPDGLAARFEASRLPLAIGGASEAAAIAALSDAAAARARLTEIVAQRERLAAAFGDLGWRVLPSLANFLLVRPPDAHAIAGALLRQGLAVRSYPSGPLRDWLRITVRAPAENDRLLVALGFAG